MAYITLEEAKRHCNIETSFTEDDSHLTLLIDVAEKAVEEDICESLKNLEEDGKIPSPLKQAALLLIGHYYNSREPVAFVASMEVPLSYRHLIMLYRNYAG